MVQVGSSLVMYGKVRGVTAPSWISGLHRWSGRIAFIFTVPVVVHCVYALGFQTFNARVLLHSIAGCLFFGAFTVKMLALTRRGMPGWVLPVLGGLAFAPLLVALLPRPRPLPWPAPRRSRQGAARSSTARTS